MYKLRDYQEEAVRHSLEFFNSSAKYRPILMLPTGSGKSVIIAHAVKKLSGNVLILQPTAELLEQNYRKYEAVISEHPELELEPASVYSASVGVKERGRVTFATIGSIYNKADEFSDTNYVLVDECHLVSPKKDKFDKDTDEQKIRASMYMFFFQSINAKKVLGLTATPFRLKSYHDSYTESRYSKINLLPDERPMFFNKFLYVVNAKKMFDEGYLCRMNYVGMKWNGNFLQFNGSGSEYTDESMRVAMERNDIIGRIPGIIEQAFKKGRNSCLVFVRTVDEAKRLSEVTPFSGYLHAKTPAKERRDTIARFKKGDIKTLFNVAILTAGFDYPSLDTVILARPTMSIVLYMQMIGRGSRTAEGKDHCTIVDMCGNIQKFGTMEEIRVENDPKAGWVLRNDRKIISGRRLDVVTGY